MTALPVNNTARIFVDYTTCGHQHSLECRFDAPNTPNDASADVAVMLLALGGSVYKSTLLGLRYVVAGGHVSVPFTDPDFPATWGTTGEGPENATADYISFIGRSTGGHRSKVDVFGAALTVHNEKYREPRADSAALDAALTIIEDAEGAFLAIDALQPLWKQYANLGTSAYWRNRIR